jgi:RHS repeat-associated protein
MTVKERGRVDGSQWGLWRLVGGVLGVVVVGLMFGVGSASAALPEIETRHMPEIVEWVYRNGSSENTVSCGTVCTDMWALEHGSGPATSQALWDALGTLETSTELWGSMGQLESALAKPELTVGVMATGWHIGREHDKWLKLELPVEAAPPMAFCSASAVALKPPGHEFEPTYFTKVTLPGWAYVLNTSLCGSGFEIQAETNKPEEAPCKPTGEVTSPGAAWVPVEWWWNEDNCGRNEKGELIVAHLIAHDWYSLFHFARPEDWSEQHVTGQNVYTFGAHNPGLAAVKTATEAELESSEKLRTWVQEALEGSVGSAEEEYGSSAASSPNKPKCLTLKPVNCATGNEVETQTDLSVGGRGPGLKLTRTYNSQLAAKQGSPGAFGFGWTGSYSAHMEGSEETGRAVIYQDDGSTVRFVLYNGRWLPLGPLVQATLAKEGSGYVYTLPNETALHFNSSGQLTSEVDRNGNSVTMSRNAEGRLESVADGAGRKLSFAYNGEGLMESVKDPMGHTVKYTYEAKNLASVTQPGEAGLRWQFKYDASHQMTSQTDGRGHATTMEYDSSHRVILQTDPMERKRKWQYFTAETGSETKITEPNGSETIELFNLAGLLTRVTRAAGTSLAATTTDEYDANYNLILVTNPDKHAIAYGYDAAGDRTSSRNELGDKTEWTYNTTHDVLTTTTPDGETTTIKRDAHGNPEVIERPAPGKTTQATKEKWAANGDLESVEDPLKRVWKYEYNAHGDKSAEIDPEGDKRTWEYNEDSQETATVSPRGHVKAGEEAKYTTKTERDAQGRPLTITDPLGHKAKYTYDGNGNPETQTDPNGNKTTYTYDADNERTKTEAPNKTVTETGYDNAGQVTSQTDGKKNTTKYVRNALEEVTEVVDARERKTLKEYDVAGNLTKLTDAAKRTTTITYDAVNRHKEVTYSDGKTPAVKWEYNGDGKVTHMTDGTGETTSTYDELDRLTETVNGHKEKVSYEWDLANEQTKITYPNGKAITRSFDKAGRLEKVTDWAEHATKFAYDADTDLSTITFPTGTSNIDKYTYNAADQMSEAKMTKGAETLASLAYTRDNDGQLKSTTSKGLPGEEKPADEYDPNSRLKKAGTNSYEYDAADNPTKLGTGAYTYDKANQLETGPSVKYAYNEFGQRTTTTPTTGSVTSYGWDQAGNLISVERAKEGEKAAINDTYTYDGNSLRASQTVAGATTYLAWDTTGALPLLLSDETNNYIYGPGGLPVEQISSTGTVLYLHHDQQGSTRLLTSSTGAKEATFTFDAYGNTTGTTGTAKTPLGYDGQYTSSDTGLIYLRARTYDPATAQFLSVDPLAPLTEARYTYAGDNPLNVSDPTGLLCFGPDFLCKAVSKAEHVLEGAGETAWEGIKKLNPVPYYEAEVRDYENGCGYWPSVLQGVKGALTAGLDVFAAGKVAQLGVAADAEFGLRGRALGALHELQTHPIWGKEDVRDLARKGLEWIIHHHPG